MTQTAHHQLGADMEQCIKLCEECHHTCLETITYCLGHGGKHAEAAHIGLLLDCATICHTSTEQQVAIPTSACASAGASFTPFVRVCSAN